MITDLQTQANVKEFFPLSETRYENIFNMAKTDAYYFYNIIKKISSPSDLSQSVFFEKVVTANIPWTAFSYNVYGDQNLWWLICCVNKIQNPTINPVIGKIYKVIKPTLVSRVLAKIAQQIK